MAKLSMGDLCKLVITGLQEKRTPDTYPRLPQFFFKTPLMQCLPELKNGHFWGHLCLSNTIMTICWKCLANSEPYKIAYSKCYSSSKFLILSFIQQT